MNSKQRTLNLCALIVILMLGIATNLCAQNKTVSGRVTDAQTGQPLPGVNILVVGTSTGAATDANDHYTVSVPSLQDTLRFSFIGYKTKTIPINKETTIDIKLTPTIVSGNQLVVIGYGKAKKKLLTGSVASVSAKSIASEPVNTIGQQLQGKAAGVRVVNTSNSPGKGVAVHIRGNNSILSSGQPLYVIDGVPISNFNGLPTLNPDDIKSIDVLKDASSTAIYGSRGSNGVVLITTKVGRAHKNIIGVKIGEGVQMVAHELDLLNARQFATVANAAIKNDNQSLPLDQQTPLPYKDPDQFGKGTNWQNLMYRRAVKQNYALTFSGGSEQTQYYISGNFLDQRGLRVGDKFQKGSVQINVNSQPVKHFTVGEHLTVSRDVRTPENIISIGVERPGQGSEVSLSTIALPATLPVKQKGGSYSVLADIPTVGTPRAGNPLGIVRTTSNEAYRNILIGSMYGTYNFLKNLSLKIKLGYSTDAKKQNLYIPIGLYTHGFTSEGRAFIEHTEKYRWVNENTLNYKGVLNESNSIDLLAGFSIQGSHISSDLNRSYGYSTNYFKYNNLGSGSSLESPSSSLENSRLISYFGRVRYNNNDTYLLTGAFRVDGSSKFGRNNRYGVFPSGAAGWVISNENFMKNIKAINLLKLRASYGITGNSAIGYYSSYSLIGSDSYTFGGNRVIGLGPGGGSIANPNLEWEKTAEFDIGLNSKFINNRLGLTIDYYHKKTNHLLLEMNIPPTSGFTQSLQNIGSISNRGWEFSIQNDNFRGKFNWNTRLNISTNKGKVLSLGPNKNLFFSSDLRLGDIKRIIAPGKAIGDLYGYDFAGLWKSEQQIKSVGTQPNAKPGSPQYKDINHDGQINAADRTIIGNTSPDFTYGIDNNFHYKALTLDIFLQGSYGNDLVSALRPWLAIPTGLNNHSVAVLNRWTPKNKNTDIPRATNGGSYSRLPNSSWMVVNGSYLRIKTVRLEYHFQSSVLQALRLNSGTMFLDIQNLYTVTSFKGYDPDVNTRGQSNIIQGEAIAGYPLARIYSIGINFKF
jgi:TonB-linked SusC/RagA family outer membrane protein